VREWQQTHDPFIVTLVGRQIWRLVWAQVAPGWVSHEVEADRGNAGAVSLVEGVVGLGIGLLTAKH
jgi:hypothetical protein